VRRASTSPPRTPDGRYFLIEGRLWRATDPSLTEETRERLVADLMAARRAVRAASDERELRAARASVGRAKRALGERGRPWWTDGSPDYNRHLAKNTPYAAWAEAILRFSPANATRPKPKR
jgi:hypothetical protein